MILCIKLNIFFLLSIDRNQEAFLDADGVNLGQPPIRASCTFPDAKVTLGKETIVNDQRDSIFENEIVPQMNNIMEASLSCSQSFQFDCASVPLKHPVSKQA